MQRWIVLGVVAMMLALGGAYAGYKTYQSNRPGPIWVPLTIRPDLEKEKRDQTCESLKAYVMDDARVLAVVRDLELARIWSLDSEEDAAAELKRRIFVRQGRAGGPFGDAPAINVGVQGKQKEKPMTKRIVERIMKDVQMVIDMPQYPGK